MKKFFMIAVMAVAALTANAQKPETGSLSIMPRIGVGYSIFNNLQYKDGATGKYEDIKGNVSMEAGAELNYQVADAFSLSAGLDYAYIQSAKSETTVLGVTVDNTVKLGYLEIPVMGHVWLGDHFSFGAGVEPTIKVNATLGDEKASNVKSFLVQVPVELQYAFDGGFTLGVRYGIPCTKAVEYGEKNAKWSAVMLTFGYNIDL